MLTKKQRLSKLNGIFVSIANLKTQNKIVQDANADELDFYELDADDTPDIGDRVSVDDDKKYTGQRVMPDGSTVIIKEGVLIDILESEDDHLYAKHNCVAHLKNNEGEVVKIYGDADTPFAPGNRVTVNSKKNQANKVIHFQSLTVHVRYGKLLDIDNE
ncbi:hypothetical protein BST97_12105 [Nonlabens spongiae]|uniref:Uncharacterized protein n=1 Tax=Nonlabens spongiae TaxID=331648 RepID=A0A1W6MM46_9FLAO|nr:hypothetical protein [Nonlabens spongiae]ARN78673.1 hypothetical protein BST97_12105 [Nonlabens spongiae]